MVGNDWIEVKASTPKATTAATWVEMHLPNAQTLARYCAWGIGRVIFSTTIFSVVVTRNTLKMGVILCDWFEGGVKHLLKVYDALPYAGTPMSQVIEASATVINEPLEIITDIIAAIEGKQVMIIGEMGTGKSTLAQYLAYTVGEGVKVYECEGTPTDWVGLEVVGKGENWTAIELGMMSDLNDLSLQLKLRTEKGDGALVGTEQVIIAEEYPELAAKVPSAGEWLERHARRGRKAKRFTVLLSQYDRVAAWGLDGKSDLADAFFKIRLGKKAVAHAKSLKNNQLVEWLKLDQSHALLDDQPLKLPPYREMKSVTQRFGSTMLQPSPNNPKSPENQPEQSPKPASDEDSSDSSTDELRLIWRMIQRFGANKSDSTIITELLGYTGKRYDQGVQLLQKLRQQFGN